MKTKLLALVLVAGGSMFAQTRFSIGISVGQHNRGYSQAQAYTAAPVYQQGYDTRYQAPQPYNNSYEEQRFSRGYAQNQNHDFDQDDRYDNRSRAVNDHDSDDRNDNRSRGKGQDYRQNGFSNGFRNR